MVEINHNGVVAVEAAETETSPLHTALARVSLLKAAIRQACEHLSEDIYYNESGMGCGLEDRDITDRYEAMRYGWDEAMERVYSENISWAGDALSSALALSANEESQPMTDPKDAPDRIWATVNGASTRFPDLTRQLLGGWSQDPERRGVVEYVRADLVAAQGKRIAELEAERQWQPTHHHKKRGSEYQVVAVAKVQSGDWHDPCGHKVDMREVVVYQGNDGRVWVRPREEFEDGRFEALPAPPHEGTQS